MGVGATQQRRRAERQKIKAGGLGFRVRGTGSARP